MTMTDEGARAVTLDTTVEWVYSGCSGHEPWMDFSTEVFERWLEQTNSSVEAAMMHRERASLERLNEHSLWFDFHT